MVHGKKLSPAEIPVPFDPYNRGFSGNCVHKCL